MRWLSRLLVVLVVCLVAMALPAAPAQAQGAQIILSPDHGVPGTEARARGSNFTADEWVDIYYYLNGSRIHLAEVETDEDGDFPWVTFTVPESYAGDHIVRAVEDESGAYAEAVFEVKPGLTVSPEEGPVGANVTVEGHGFAEDEEDIELRYYLNGNSQIIKDDIPANEDGWWQWSFKIPPSAQGSHEIDASGDDSSFSAVEDATFKVTPAISLDKSSSSVGENVTMTGNGFAANERDIRILFAGEAVETDTEIIRANATGSWQASFPVPDRPKGTYNVTAEGEWTEREDITALTFEIEPGIVLSPGEGHVGMNLTISGQGFAANKDVVIAYDGSQKATAITNNKGNFEAIFPVPESQHGERLVTAEDTAGNNATAVFIMESDPPDTPEIISPPDGSRVGFIGKMRPTFEWSEVQDDSQVRYSLQIATSPNATATGGFGDPKVSIPDIVGTNYTLNKTEALPYGTYYWIVQAVDRAGNKSNWTEPVALRVGLLPLWAFILSIVALVVLIAALVYFFIIRRRIHYY